LTVVDELMYEYVKYAVSSKIKLPIIIFIRGGA
jgi:hypothetical protein